MNFILLTVLLLLPSAAKGAFTFKAQDDPTLSANFNPQSVGWLGADVSTSIQLSEDNYLWLWGDTLVGNIAKSGNAEYRNLSGFPHSSLGFVDLNVSQKPSFWFRTLPNSKELDPMGVFTPQNPTNPKEFYWTVAGIVTPTTKNLIVVTQVIIDVSSGLGFQQIGTDIVLVANPTQPPQQWTYTTSRIASSNTNLTWNSGITYSDGYFYLVGLDTGNAYLARITEADIVKFNWAGMSYWSKGNQWTSTTSNLLAIYPSVYTEGTLQYHSYMQRWFVILAQAYQGSIYIAYSEEITGPYTVESIYDYPKQYQNGTFFAYAGKSHPEYAGAQEIVFTYNVNANSLNLLFHDLDIYHPKFVRVAIST